MVRSSPNISIPACARSIEMEDSEKPSFENFLSKPSTLTDHLIWQLGSLHVNEDVYRAAELVIGNLNEEGYLIATDDELLGLAEEEMAGAPPPADSAGCGRTAPETTESLTASPVSQPSPESHADGKRRTPALQLPKKSLPRRRPT